MAVNCSVAPALIEGLAGVTAIDTNVGAFTVRVVVPLIEPEVAVIVVLPCASLVANPAALIVATLVVPELHVTVSVRFSVELLLYFPVAVNCSVAPAVIEGLAGVTAMDSRVGAVTVSVVEPLIEPDVAVIVVLPCATLVARPAALMVATLVDEELHDTVSVRFPVEPLLYVPVAVNCCFVPRAIEGLAGVIEIDESTLAARGETGAPVATPPEANALGAKMKREVARKIRERAASHRTRTRLVRIVHSQTEGSGKLGLSISGSSNPVAWVRV